MKTRKLLTIGILTMSAFLITACNSEKNDQNEKHDHEVEDTHAQSETYQLNLEMSKVNWVATMVGPDLIKLLKTHYGEVNFNAGTIVLAGDQVKSGSFIIDMTTIEAKDTNYNEDYPKSKLLGHLASDDFFMTSDYPTASFTLNKVDGNKGTGTLSIRGKSGEETIEDIKVEKMGNHYMISGKLIFDRQKYDVRFDMGAADMIVSDDVQLNIMMATGSKK